MSEEPEQTRTIAVDMVARVEGEGALRVTVKDGTVQNVELKIFEPPRFFEAFLKGRHYEEVPDIVARICGICPIAYQMSAVHALEQIFGLRVEGALHDLRRLIYCGEWIESHALHVYLLQAPDFLGYDSAVAMAKDHATIVTRGLRLKKAGNAIMTLLGGRSVHPVSVKVGGFSRVPLRRELEDLKDELLWARDAAVETVRWVTDFDYPDFETDYNYVALRHPDEYPFNEGQIAATSGLQISAHEFEQHFTEHQVAYSNALHCTLQGSPYMVGPLARLNWNQEHLTPLAKQALADNNIALPLRNPFYGIIARSIEILYALEESLGLIERYEAPPLAAAPITVRAGIGMACTEAPRGMLYHRYEVDGDGVIRDAKIVPPTSQNQSRIEQDLRLFMPRLLRLPDKEAALACERVIRCYDPCISCATHFLNLEIRRESSA
ncbi:MAG: Ni/Fe hydrogenase subunit alpha [Nitrospira sp.]|nr:Ni/Fe hydrogenase subunit alpha [Nitrospira sp.]